MLSDILELKIEIPFEIIFKSTHLSCSMKFQDDIQFINYSTWLEKFTPNVYIGIITSLLISVKHSGVNVKVNAPLSKKELSVNMWMQFKQIFLRCTLEHFRRE